MTDFLEIDYCKGRAMRIARRFNVSGGITSEQLAGATSLGCNYPVSHRDNGVGPGIILSRVSKQSGARVAELLESANESLTTNPGPTAWLSGAPDAFLTGNVTLPFPGNMPSVIPSLSSPSGPVQLSFQTIGFGGATGFREMVIVPPGDLEYLAPFTLAQHPALWRYGAVSSPNPFESYRLRYVNASTVTGTRPVFLWTGVAGQGTSVEQNKDNDIHTIGFSVVGTPPVLSGHQTPVRTPSEGFSVGLISATNGPGQTNRKFSYPVVGTLTNPDWNGAVTPEFTIAGTRPTLTIFAQGEFLDAVGFDVLTINGLPLSFQSVALPFEQYQAPPQFSEGSTTDPSNFFNSQEFTISTSPLITGQLYGQANVAAQIEIPIGATSLSVQIQTTDSESPISSFTITIPKAAGQAAWFEVILTAWTRTTGGA